VFGWIVVLVLVTPLSVRAEVPSSEVIVTGDTIADDAWQILQGAFARDGVALSSAPGAPDCTAALTSPALRARVWITWSAGSAAQLCFQDHCQVTSRTLGPFAKLDARAREALITVIESGLAALRSACSDERAEPALAERAASGVAPPPPPKAAGVEPAADGGNAERASAASPQAGGTGQGAAPASATLSVSNQPALPSDQASPKGGPADVSSGLAGPRFSLGASYGFMRWNAQTLSQLVAGLVAFAPEPVPLYVGAEAAYAPGLRADRDDLAIHGTGLRIALLVWGGLPLSQRLSLDAQLGLAIQWLWLAPSAETAALVAGTRSASHADPALLLRIGPSLQLLSALRVGIDLGLDASWVERSYGFSTADGSLAVFAPDPLRLSLALYARVVL
jgi:hypothetical protein